GPTRLSSPHVPDTRSAMRGAGRVVVLGSLAAVVGCTHGLPDAWSVQDHGNHVAGIMCARHNGLGVKGVLPNCSVAAAGGSFLIAGYSPIEGDDAIAFQARLSEYLATVLTFMEKNPDAKVINLSLGYNWMPNFRADPRTPDNAFLRDIVRSQGRIFQAILAYAKARDIVIFSAAGNDSTSLSSPLEAEWASPFNFGAKLMKDAEGWSNGVIVEAHGQNNRRASFSNVGGDISCPGVDIKSSLARPSNSYGLMSGTSMASPYCAASYAALRSLHPTLPVRKTLECYLGVSGRIEGRVPKMDLKAAHEACQQ
ncbi:MAG: S8 family serine peptidase, partial [Parvularculaceae bacterium]